MSVHSIRIRRMSVETVLAMVRDGFEVVPVVRCNNCGNDRADGWHTCHPDEPTLRALLQLAANTVTPSPEGLERIRRETHVAPTADGGH